MTHVVMFLDMFHVDGFGDTGELVHSAGPVVNQYRFKCGVGRRRTIEEGWGNGT